MASTSHESVSRRSLAAHRPLPPTVTGSKGGPWYTSHTYPTKVPPETIVPFIEASTAPGGLVADPFCGSGMTGVAAALAGRRAALSDLSPGAVHLARNHTRRVSPELLTEAVAALDRSWMRRTERDLYWSSIDTDNGVIHGLARHTVWSEVYECPTCASEIVLWDATEPDRPLPRDIRCDGCRWWFDRRGRCVDRIHSPVDHACSRVRREAGPWRSHRRSAQPDRQGRTSPDHSVDADCTDRLVPRDVHSIGASSSWRADGRRHVRSSAVHSAVPTVASDWLD